MAKERMLTVVVPIKDGDYTEWAGMSAPTLADFGDTNTIYRFDNLFYRKVKDDTTGLYTVTNPTDREFPHIGKPLEIFDFTYTATRMGSAPTISAQGVMWYADKNDSGVYENLDNLWTKDCHVIFNDDVFYLKQVPTSSKSNEDARYKYDIDFVSQIVALENVYFFDVVSPFVSARIVSESASFSFFGGVDELAKRINASLIRSGLTEPRYKDGMSASTVLTYEEWNLIGLGQYSGTKPIRGRRAGTSANPWYYFYPTYRGNYEAYLHNEVYETENGTILLTGYQCVIGKGKNGEDVKSEEKLLTFDGNTVYEALQQVKETFELQYFVTKEYDSDGNYTGNTLIVIGDCEHDFADVEDDDFVRDSDGVPTTASPFGYGVEDALLSIEKSNATDKIVTRITGVGSTENIPWYYPNPTADGWIKPIHMRDGEITGIQVGYQHPVGLNSDMRASTLYEKYLANRIGDEFVYGNPQYVSYKVREESEVKLKDGDNDGYFVIILDMYYGNNRRILLDVAFKHAFKNISVNLRWPKGQSGEIYGDVMSLSKMFPQVNGITYNNYAQLTIKGAIETNPTETDGPIYYFYPEHKQEVGYLQTWPWNFVLWFAPLVVGVLGLVVPVPILKEYIAKKLGTFDVKTPAFLSTNPNLKYTSSRDMEKCRWRDGKNNFQVNSDGFIPLEPNKTYYVFMGGEGEKDINKDTIYELRTHGGYYTGTQNPNFFPSGYDLYNDFADMVNWLMNNKNRESKISPTYTIEPVAYKDATSFISRFVDINIKSLKDVWGKNGKDVKLVDYGITNEDELSESVQYFDSIGFQRAKYITPQQSLMPEAYIQSDGERRFYIAHNYDQLSEGIPDVIIGEESASEDDGLIINPIYKENEDDELHYEFENEYKRETPHEHIENFEDLKPSIVGQKWYIRIKDKPSDWETNYSEYFTREESSSYYRQNASAEWDSNKVYYRLARIDVVEEFAFDELDNDEVWEEASEDSVKGEYKHPYIFAKLRPLGFNIFDLALQDEMVLSVTTGHCGSCNFKIGVDENTGKNPVQIWERDVYEQAGDGTYSKVFKKGELRRCMNINNLYYIGDDGEYYNVNLGGRNTVGFLVDEETTMGMFKTPTYNTDDVTNGLVGATKKKQNVHFEGDVVTSGRFIDSQQDTTEDYVWVALMKDTESYGTIMPSARPDYADSTYSMYIDPIGHKYRNRATGEEIIVDDEEADKFVLTNIRMPQVYLRRAERDLARRLVAYMHDNNAEKFNFSVKFSRIFLAQNENIEKNLNANSVLYIRYNNKTYRQYVKNYTYKMTRDAVLPEISIDLNEELQVVKTRIQQEAAMRQRFLRASSVISNRRADRIERRISTETIGKNDDVIITGNIISRSAGVSVNDLHTAQTETSDNLMQNYYQKAEFGIQNGTDLIIGDNIRLATPYMRGNTIRRREWSDERGEFIDNEENVFAPAFITTDNRIETADTKETPAKVLQIVDATTYTGDLSKINTFNAEAAAMLNKIKATIEYRIKPDDDVSLSISKGGCDIHIFDIDKYTGMGTVLWLNEDGTTKSVRATDCPSSSNMNTINWDNISITN